MLEFPPTLLLLIPEADRAVCLEIWQHRTSSALQEQFAKSWANIGAAALSFRDAALELRSALAASQPLDALEHSFAEQAQAIDQTIRDAHG